MSDWIDHSWRSDHLAALTAALAEQDNVLGPVLHDDHWYAVVRAAAPLPLPDNCALADPALTAQLLGVWA